MFAPTTFKPTYSGPITATGETMRRARSDAVSQGLAQANRRSIRPMQTGVQAGTGNQRYRTNLLQGLGQQEAMASGRDAYNQYAQQNAGAGLAYDGNLATEMAGLRDLLFGKLQADTKFDLGSRELEIDRELAEARRRAASELGESQLMGDKMGMVTGLLGSTNRLANPELLARGRLITPKYYDYLSSHMDDYKNYGQRALLSGLISR